MASFLQTIPCFVIHREQDKDREPLIQTLQRDLHSNLIRVEGVNGSQLVADGHPTKHPHEKNPTTVGNVGCTASHIHIIRTALSQGQETIAIFEDDAVLHRAINDEIFLLNPWDMVLLGTNEIVESIMKNVIHVRRFWGTHAVVLRGKAMRAILSEYERLVKEGYAYPADWLYSAAIKNHDLIAVTPQSNYIIQKEGIVSICTGKIRTLNP
jgi:GR25 family glycosyltransferase involved in LPS biosynthesis